MIENTRYYWGTPARVLHWLAALLIVSLFLHGELYLEDHEKGAGAAFQLGLHASAGVTLAVITLARLFWRVGNETPLLPAHMTPFERVAAEGVQVVLYLLTFAVILTGWAMTGSLGQEVTMRLFGLIPVPAGPADLAKPTKKLAEDAHELLAMVLIGIATMHAAAALWHHFVKGDSILRRMVIGRQRQRQRNRTPS